MVRIRRLAVIAAIMALGLMELPPGPASGSSVATRTTARRRRDSDEGRHTP